MSELLDDIAARLGSAPLPSDQASHLLEGWARAYGISPDLVWWWSTRTLQATRTAYTDHVEWARLLGDTLAGIPGDEVLLVSTDDEPPPWPVWSIAKTELIPLLEDLQVFEYFIAASDGRTLVFDTHHDELVVAAQPLPGI